MRVREVTQVCAVMCRPRRTMPRTLSSPRARSPSGMRSLPSPATRPSLSVSALTDSALTHPLHSTVLNSCVIICMSAFDGIQIHSPSQPYNFFPVRQPQLAGPPQRRSSMTSRGTTSSTWTLASVRPFPHQSNRQNYAGLTCLGCLPKPLTQSLVFTLLIYSRVLRFRGADKKDIKFESDDMILAK